MKPKNTRPNAKGFLAWEKVGRLLKDRDSKYTFDTKNATITIPERRSLPEDTFSIFHLTYDNLLRLSDHYVTNDRELNANIESAKSFSKNKHKKKMKYPTLRSEPVEEFNENNEGLVRHICGLKADTLKRCKEHVAHHASIFTKRATNDMRIAWGCKTQNERLDVRDFILEYGDAKTVISLILDMATTDDIDVNEHKKAIKTILDSQNSTYIASFFNACRHITIDDVAKACHNDKLLQELTECIFSHDNKKNVSQFLEFYNGPKLPWTDCRKSTSRILRTGTDKEISLLSKSFILPKSRHPDAKRAIRTVLEGGNPKYIAEVAKSTMAVLSRVEYGKTLNSIMEKSSVEDMMLLIKACDIYITDITHPKVLDAILKSGSPSDIRMILINNHNIKLIWNVHQKTIERVFESGTPGEVSALCHASTGLPITREQYPNIINDTLNSSATNIATLLKACPRIYLNVEKNQKAIGTILAGNIYCFAMVIASNEHNSQILFNEIMLGSKRTNLEKWKKKLADSGSFKCNTIVRRFLNSLETGKFNTLRGHDYVVSQKLRLNYHNSKYLPAYTEGQLDPASLMSEQPLLQIKNPTTDEVGSRNPKPSFNEEFYADLTNKAANYRQESSSASYSQAPSFDMQYYPNPTDTASNYYQSSSFEGAVYQNPVDTMDTEYTAIDITAVENNQQLYPVPTPTFTLGSEYAESPLQGKQQTDIRARYNPYSQSGQGMDTMQAGHSRLTAQVSPMPQVMMQSAPLNKEVEQAPSGLSSNRIAQSGAYPRSIY